MNLALIDRLDLITARFDTIFVPPEVYRELTKRRLPGADKITQLVELKLAGRISAVKPIMQELIARANFWVSPELYDQVLRAVGEDAAS